MDGSDDKIRDGIAALSEQLSRLYEKHGTVDHPALLECSAQLDRLIVQWYRTGRPNTYPKGRGSKWPTRFPSSGTTR